MKENFYLPADLGIMQIVIFNKESHCFKTYLK